MSHGSSPRHRRLRRLAPVALGVAGWACLGGGGAHAASVPQIECPALPVPPQTRQQVIAPRIIIDGRLMSIVGADTKLSSAAFAQFYKTLWQGAPGKPLYVENTLGPWDVVAHGQAQCFYTVQIRPDGKGGTAALLGTAAVGGSFREGALDFPAPGDARPLTHMVSDDGGMTGDTWLLYTGNNAPSVVAWYTRNMPSLGWHPDMPPGSSPKGTVLMYSRGHRHAGIVVAPFRAGAAITFTVISR